MKMFALQNSDLKEFYWSESLGWTDEDNADWFSTNDLDDDYCIKLFSEKKGKWVTVGNIEYSMGIF